MATGSEVQTAVAAAGVAHIPVRVVSMPCTELFDAQSHEYRASIFPDGTPVLSVEAGAIYGWEKVLWRWRRLLKYSHLCFFFFRSTRMRMLA